MVRDSGGVRVLSLSRIKARMFGVVLEELEEELGFLVLVLIVVEDGGHRCTPKLSKGRCVNVGIVRCGSK